MRSEGNITAVMSEGNITAVVSEGNITAVMSEGNIKTVMSEGIITTVMSEDNITTVVSEGNTVKPAVAVTCIKRDPPLSGHFKVPPNDFECKCISIKRAPVQRGQRSAKFAPKR